MVFKKFIVWRALVFRNLRDFITHPWYCFLEKRVRKSRGVFLVLGEFSHCLSTLEGWTLERTFFTNTRLGLFLFLFFLMGKFETLTYGWVTRRKGVNVITITRVAGIEPTHMVLKTTVLPLNYTPLEIVNSLDSHQLWLTIPQLSFTVVIWALEISLTATASFSVDMF